MPNIERPVQPILPGNHQHPVKGGLPPVGQVKQKERTEERMQALLAAKTEKQQLGQIGSKAHLKHIKAQIEAVPVGELRVNQAKLGKLKTLQKYTFMAARATGKGLLKLPGVAVKGAAALVKYPVSPILNLVKNHRAASSLRQSAKDCEAKAEGLEAFAANLRREAGSVGLIDGLKGKEDLNYQKAIALIDSAEKFEKNAKDTRLSADIFRQQAQAIGGKKQLASDFATQGVGRVSKLATAGKLGIQATEKIALWSNADTIAGGAASLGGAVTGIGIATGAVTAVLETKELIQNVKIRDAALSRREGAQALLTDQAGRETMIQKLESQASKAEAGGLMSKKNPEKAAELRAKAEAIRAISNEVAAGKAIDDETRAVAEQIDKRADTGFKMGKILRNTLGITSGVGSVVAGALALTVLAGAMATPVGWAVAGVAIGLSVTALVCTAGQAIYSKYKASQREDKIAMAENNHTQTQAKLDLLRQQETAFSAAERELPEGQAEIGKINAQIESLENLQKDNVLQLMAASPERAARLIYDGARAGDKSLSYLAAHVLKVSIGTEAEDVVLSRLAAGMSIQPRQ